VRGTRRGETVGHVDAQRIDITQPALDGGLVFANERLDHRRQRRRGRAGPSHEPPRIGYCVGGDSQPCRQAPVPSTLFDVADGLDRFQYRSGIGVPLLPYQRSRECYSWKKHTLSMVQGGCSGIGGAAGLLGFGQLCEIGLCEAEPHRRLDRRLGGADALKPVMCVSKPCRRIRCASSAEQQPAELECGVTGPPEIAAPLEGGDRTSQRPLGCRMAASRQQPLHLDADQCHARLQNRRALPVRGSPFRCIHDVHSFQRSAPRKDTDLPHSKLMETQYHQRGARRHVAPVQHNNGTVSQHGRNIVGARRIAQECEVAWHKSKLPKHSRIRKVRQTENPRRGRACVFEPFDDGSRPLSAKGLSWSRRIRARFEPMRPPDETKIEKDTFGVCPRAGLRPCLLLGARTGSIDTNANACAGGQIEGRETCRSIRVEPC
jgi:hypothetical protein